MKERIVPLTAIVKGQTFKTLTEDNVFERVDVDCRNSALCRDIKSKAKCIMSTGIMVETVSKSDMSWVDLVTWASGFYLSATLPDEYVGSETKEVMLFVRSNTWDMIDHFSPEEVLENIYQLANSTNKKFNLNIVAPT